MKVKKMAEGIAKSGPCKLICGAIVSGSILLSGCATTEELIARGKVRCEDPLQSLWITVKSVPAGADVFGIADGSLGSRLGTTPLTLKYCPLGDGGYYGEALNQTLTVKSCEASPWADPQAFVAFRCVVAMDGYSPYIMKQTLVSKVGRHGLFVTDCGWQMASEAITGRQETFTAVLQPKVDADSGTP